MKMTNKYDLVIINKKKRSYMDQSAMSRTTNIRLCPEKKKTLTNSYGDDNR